MCVHLCFVLRCIYQHPQGLLSGPSAVPCMLRPAACMFHAGKLIAHDAALSVPQRNSHCLHVHQRVITPTRAPY